MGNFYMRIIDANEKHLAGWKPYKINSKGYSMQEVCIIEMNRIEKNRNELMTHLYWMKQYKCDIVYPLKIQVCKKSGKSRNKIVRHEKNINNRSYLEPNEYQGKFIKTFIKKENGLSYPCEIYFYTEKEKESNGAIFELYLSE